MALLNAPHQILVVSGNNLPDAGYVGDLYFKTAAPGIGWWYRDYNNVLIYWGPRLAFVGAWDPSVTYNHGDVVTFGGTAYVAVTTGTNEIPPNATYWGALAVQGAQGAQGFPGMDGDEGDDGLDGFPGPQGATGPAGPPGASQWQGPWDVSTPYVEYDIVFDAGSSWVCILANTGNEPPNATYWEAMAERGATWWSGSGAPTLVVGSKAWDYYMDEDSGLVYVLS